MGRVAGGGWRRLAAGRLARRGGRSAGGGRPVPRLHTGIRDVLAAGDLLVSPVRYESCGLNVEALCRGLAVMVTRSAGVVERFDGAMTEGLLPDGITPVQLADRLRSWRADVQGWRARAAATAARLRARSWTDMAASSWRLRRRRKSAGMTRTHRFLTGFMTGYAHLVLATIAGLWLTPFFLRELGQSTYGLWLVGTQIIAYLLLMDLGIVALLPRETAYITGRTNRHDAPELRELLEKTLTLACVQTPVVLVAALIALWWLPASWAAARAAGCRARRVRADLSTACLPGGAHRPAGSGVRGADPADCVAGRHGRQRGAGPSGVHAVGAGSRLVRDAGHHHHGCAVRRHHLPRRDAAAAAPREVSARGTMSRVRSGSR